MRRALAALSLAALAGSCETMTPEQCQLADWRSLGYQDGAAGQSMTKFSDREKSCAKAGVQARIAPYLTGREEGLRSFCRPERGFRAGLDGYRYVGDCPSELEPEFMLGYSDGVMAYQAKQKLAEAESEISALRAKLDSYDSDAERYRAVLRDDRSSPESREKAKRRLAEIHNDRHRAREDLGRAERDRYWREGDLDRLRAALGPRWGGW